MRARALAVVAVALAVALAVAATRAPRPEPAAVDPRLRRDAEVAALIVRARALLERNLVDGALENAARAVELDPSHCEGWVTAGRCRLARGELPLAAQAAARAAALGKRRASPEVLLADVHLALGREALRRAGGAARAGEEAARAHEAATRALEREPRSGEARATLALAKLMAGQDALADSARAVELDPLSARARRARALALLRAGDERGALEHATRATELAPRDPEAWLARAALSGEGALAAALEATRLAPASWEAWIALARAAEGEVATRACSEAVRREPEAPLGWRLRAERRLAGHDLSGAESDATRAIELEPDSPDAHLTRALARLETGRASDVLADAEAALRLAPRLDRALEVLERVWARSKDASVQAIVNSLVLRDGDFAHARALRGRVRADAGETAGAIDDLERALALEPAASWAPAARERLAGLRR